MYIPALLNWWSIVKWIKTKKDVYFKTVYIYICIHMPITLCNTRNFPLEQPHVHNLGLSPPERRMQANTHGKHVPLTASMLATRRARGYDIATGDAIVLPSRAR